MKADTELTYAFVTVRVARAGNEQEARDIGDKVETAIYDMGGDICSEYEGNGNYSTAYIVQLKAEMVDKVRLHPLVRRVYTEKIPSSTVRGWNGRIMVGVGTYNALLEKREENPIDPETAKRLQDAVHRGA